jgi:hypothetical protein
MRAAAISLVVLAAAGCGGAAGTGRHIAASGRTLSADGMAIELPDGWSGRIVIGASGRPVLHAASFVLESNDTDEGQIAEEELGATGMYLNVRDLSPGDAGESLPARFAASDFGPTAFEGGVRRQASLELASDGERFRVTAVSGGVAAPAQPYLDELNAALASLRLTAYAPTPVGAATGDAIRGYGMHANLPSGWTGGIARGDVHASDGRVDLSITESDAPDAGSFVTGRMPLLIGPAEFVHQSVGAGYETGRSFVENDRQFQLWVRAPQEDPSSEELASVNAFLASFSADAGDFYPGTVEPATFAPADGWDTGTTGRAEIGSDGQQTMSWASTIPYRDSGFQFPPHATLEALPPEGVVIVAMLTQSSGQSNGTDEAPVLDLRKAPIADFEGLGSVNAPHELAFHANNYDAQVWALFGREQPTQEQLDRAQAELDRLNLPRWPPF